MHRTRRLAVLGVLALSAALLSTGTVSALAATAPPTTAGGTIGGYVLTGGGSALEGATVTARPQGGGRTYTTTAASTGQFGVTLPTGRYVVTMSASGFSTTKVGHPVVLTAGKVVSLTVHLRRPGVITGRVALKNGDPVRHARVALSGASAVTLRTNAAGTYRATVPAGRYTVAVTDAGYAIPAATTVRVRAAATTTARTRTLRDQAVVSGHVRDASGAGIASVRMRITRLGGTRAAGVPTRWVATTTEAGTYRVDGLRVGRYRIAVVLTTAQQAVYAASQPVVVHAVYGEHAHVPVLLGAAG